MSAPIERVCRACGQHFLLSNGETRTCPGCGRNQVALVKPKAISRVASSLRASDYKGWRFLGQHGSEGHRRETSFAVRGQKPNRQALAEREAMRRALAEKQAYWKAETADIETEFGPLVAMRFQELLEL